MFSSDIVAVSVSKVQSRVAIGYNREALGADESKVWDKEVAASMEILEHVKIRGIYDD